MQWNDLVKSEGSESGAFLQTLEWGAFQASIGRTVFYIASANGQPQLIAEAETRQAENIDGLALAILMPISFNKKFLYIPRGPIGENTEPLIELAIKIAREQKAIFVKIESTIENRKLKIENRKSFGLQPEKTVILDLTKDAKDLLAAMHTKTRYNIALARRHNVRITKIDPSTMPLFESLRAPLFEPEPQSRRQSLERQDDVARQFDQWFHLMSMTARRDGFHAHEKEYYKKLLNINSNFKTALWLAFDGEDLLAGNLTGYFNNTVTYLHGASSNTKRNLMAPFLLHWEIILDAQKNGFTAYDFWGIDSKKWPGLSRFKQNFGNESTLREVSYPKAIDIPLNKFWHFLYKLKKTLIH